MKWFNLLLIILLFFMMYFMMVTVERNGITCSGHGISIMRMSETIESMSEQVSNEITMKIANQHTIDEKKRLKRWNEKQDMGIVEYSRQAKIRIKKARDLYHKSLKN